jgi:hypothetical protein
MDYPLKAAHIVEERADGTKLVELELSDGSFIMAVDPKTRQCTTERKRFTMRPSDTTNWSSTLTP